MKLIINQNVLVTALGLAKRVVGKSTLPVLAMARLNVTPGRLEVTCSNLEQELRVSVPVKTDIKKAASFCVRAHLFHAIAKALPEADALAELTLEHSGDTLRVVSQESDYELGTLAGTEFPPTAAMRDAVTVRLNQAQVQLLLASTSSAISEYDGRYILCGAFLQITEDLACAATDGRRLALAEAALGGTVTPANCILPAAAVGELIALLGTDEESQVVVELEPDRARFIFSASAVTDLIFTTKLIEGIFPNYRNVLPPPGTEVNIERLPVLSALRRVMLVGRKLRLQVKDTTLTLTATAEPGEVAATACERVPCSAPVVRQGAVRALRMVMSADYLLDALTATDWPQLVLEYTGAQAALLVRSEDRTWQTAIMPMRSDEAEEATEPEPEEQPAAAKPKADATMDGEQREPRKLSVEDEALLARAQAAVMENGKCSVSLIQRWLKLSYVKANELLDELQARKIVGPTIKTGKLAGTQPLLVDAKG